MTLPLSSYDPDTEDQPKAPGAPPRPANGRCHTCHQKLPLKQPLNELRKIIAVYKMSIGVPVENKVWNKQFFPILIPTAKKMLEYLKDWRIAANCIQDTVEAIREWNPAATISMQKIHSHYMTNWEMQNREQQAKVTDEIKIL
jgi:hypothetical protein